MNTALVILITCLAAHIAEAKWRPLTEKELISNSTTIVIAEFVSSSETAESYYKVQKGEFRVSEVIKGDPVKEVTVSGSTQHICAPLVTFTGKEKGRYLLFLSRKGDLYVPVNGHFGMIPINGGKVDWFIQASEETFSAERKPLDLEQVLKRVKAG